MQHEPMEQEHWWQNPLKYFLHGILFSVLLFVLVFAWAAIFAGLILIGAFIGLIIGVILLFLIMGAINSFLTDFIWSLSIKIGWKDLLGHGFVLFIALIFANIPYLIINLLVSSLAVIIVLFIGYAFIDGFVAKKVAGYWSKERITSEKRAYEAHSKMGD